jgi:hypothetical protein
MSIDCLSAVEMESNGNGMGLLRETEVLHRYSACLHS